MISVRPAVGRRRSRDEPGADRLDHRSRASPTTANDPAAYRPLDGQQDRGGHRRRCWGARAMTLFVAERDGAIAAVGCDHRAGHDRAQLRRSGPPLRGRQQGAAGRRWRRCCASTAIAEGTIPQLPITRTIRRGLPAGRRTRREAGVAKMLGSESMTLFVAERDGVIAAVGAIIEPDTIGLNYVDPAHRFAGVSKALLEAMEEVLAPARGDRRQARQHRDGAPVLPRRRMGGRRPAGGASSGCGTIRCGSGWPRSGRLLARLLGQNCVHARLPARPAALK